jgi:hypothetical protein
MRVMIWGARERLGGVSMGGDGRKKKAVESFFVALQRLHAAVRLSGSLVPPFASGVMWSTVSACCPQ